MKNIIKKDFDELFARDLDINLLEGKTILIAGATSFLISYFIKGLLYYNDSVARTSIKIIGMVRNEEKARNIYDNYIGRADFELLIQDVTSPLIIEDNIDIIINAASQASPKYYGVDPVGTINANVIGNYNLLEFARKNKVKDFLFISSGEVYGEFQKDIIDEEGFGPSDCASLRACYSEGKRAGETMCVAYAHQYSINTKMLRLFHTYAPFMPLDDGRVFVDFVKNILRRENIVLHSDGSALRSFCYVIDMIDGLIRVLLKGEKGNAYNLANTYETYSIVALAKKLTETFQESGIKVVFDIPKKQSNSYIQSTIVGAIPCIDKIQKLGFLPKIDVAEGFRRVVESYQT